VVHILTRESNKPGQARRTHFMKNARVHIVLEYTHALKITHYVVEGFRATRRCNIWACKSARESPCEKFAARKMGLMREKHDIISCPSLFNTFELQAYYPSHFLSRCGHNNEGFDAYVGYVAINRLFSPSASAWGRYKRPSGIRNSQTDCHPCA